MNKRLLQIAPVVCIISSLFAFARAQTAVPIEKEPLHRLKFENEFVRLFDVLIPPGEATLFHEHRYDGIGVWISETQITDETVSGEKELVEVKNGVPGFSARPTPITHRVLNTGKSHFRTIFTEILQSRSGAGVRSFPVLSDGHIVLIDNDRVRVNRLTLKQGESSQLHTHEMHGFGIIVYDSKIELIGPDGSKRTLDAKAGDHAWQSAGTTHTIKNVGSTVFEAIDIELK